MNETQGMEVVNIIQADSNSLSDYLNMIMNADGRGTLVQLYKASHFEYVLLCLEFRRVLFRSGRFCLDNICSQPYEQDIPKIPRC